MRNRSIVGPIILIALGGLFLMNNLRPEFSVWEMIGRYWPFLLIGFGVLRLLEILVDAGRGRPLPPHGVGGGHWVLLLIVCMFLWGVTRRSHYTHFNGFESGRLEIFGEEYDYPVTAKGAVQGVTMLVLDNLRGNLTVTGGDGDQYEVEGHKSVRAYSRSEADSLDKRTAVHFVREGNQLIVRSDEAKLPSERRISTDLEIKLPRGVSLEARGRSGDLTVSSLTGSVDISSDRGDVRLSDIGGNARVNVTRSSVVRAVDMKGTVNIEGRGNDIQLENIVGQVAINGSYSGTLDFKNIAKPLHFESVQTDLRVEQIPGNFSMDLGDVRASNIVGPVRFRTKSRDIHIENFSDTMDIELERGDVELTPGKTPLAKIDVHARFGKIELVLPENAQFDLKARTAQGEAHNDFGTAVRADIDGRAATIQSVAGKGAAITVSTDRGDVTVRKT